MTDIWDEKPKRFIEYGYVIDGLYNAKDMDAWLERLQDEVLTAWTTDENRLTKIITERGRKLEAIKDYRRLLLSQPKGTMVETGMIAHILKGLLQSSTPTARKEK